MYKGRMFWIFKIQRYLPIPPESMMIHCMI
jgi:hypothetical protein